MQVSADILKLESFILETIHSLYTFYPQFVIGSDIKKKGQKELKPLCIGAPLITLHI